MRRCIPLALVLSLLPVLSLRSEAQDPRQQAELERRPAVLPQPFPGSGRHRIRIVDRDSGEPVPGAQLVLTRPDRGFVWRDWLPELCEQPRLPVDVFRGATLLQADSAGIVEVHGGRFSGVLTGEPPTEATEETWESVAHDSGTQLLVARSGARLGFARSDAYSGSFQKIEGLRPAKGAAFPGWVLPWTFEGDLPIAAPAGLTLELRDAAGAPVSDQLVSLSLASDLPRIPLQRGFGAKVVTLTDEHGRARFEFAGHISESTGVDVLRVEVRRRRPQPRGRTTPNKPGPFSTSPPSTMEQLQREPGFVWRLPVLVQVTDRGLRPATRELDPFDLPTETIVMVLSDEQVVR